MIKKYKKTDAVCCLFKNKILITKNDLPSYNCISYNEKMHIWKYNNNRHRDNDLPCGLIKHRNIIQLNGYNFRSYYMKHHITFRYFGYTEFIYNTEFNKNKKIFKFFNGICLEQLKKALCNEN